MRRARKRSLLWRAVRALVGVLVVYLCACLAGLMALRYADPLFTAVHAQRRVESLFEDGDYDKRQTFVPLSAISPHLQHAVVVAEDGRFFAHSGIDWLEVEKVIQEEVPRGRIRGASTLTQQLVKNLFMTTHPNPVRKPVEMVLAPVAERLLGKKRILELYLNVIEWGPGLYGAEAAARRYYNVSAARLSREQAARLAACIPAPRVWRPDRMNRSSRRILERMAGRGW
ncbi:MAG: monofunctional biosynthetic peptidoglycan transglycosylase [bacterium]|nr:monofunctional biosynthetic peptidoglycan transglycosylase [bacterium]